MYDMLSPSCTPNRCIRNISAVLISIQYRTHPARHQYKKSTDCIYFNISVDAYQDIISRPYPIIFSPDICRCCRLPGLHIYHITLFCCIYIYTSSRVILSSTLTAASGSLSPTILYALPFIRWTIVP